MYLTPAGAPITLCDVVSGVSAAASAAHATVEAAVHRISGLPHATGVSSGRAAMTVILRAIRDNAPGRDCDEVVTQAYTRNSVPAAIQRAGLKLRLCDVDPTTLDIDPDVFDRACTGASAAYPRSSANVPEVVASIPDMDRKCPGAREIARTIVTSPTHAYCPSWLAVDVRRVYAACLA